ncbi:MAG: cell surface protein SprA, partial [Bacteroidia bacterium]|nr:cell surface protein SprA [Bacteroidia bacterium]
MAAIFILQRFVNKLINLKNINIANWQLHLIVSLICCGILGSITNSFASTSLKTNLLVQEPDTLLPYPWNDRITDQWSNPFDNHPLYMSDPSNIENSIQYDPKNHEYNIYEKIGDRFFRNPSYMTFQEYTQEEFNRSTKNYWKQKSDQENAAKRKGLIPKLYVGGKAFDRIFGGNTVDIRPQGSAELIFGLQIQRNDNPALPERQRRNTNFDFQQKIQMNVIGNIGDKLKLQTNYNTEASFEFENRMKLEYTGYEDEIIQKIEAGNVTLPLTGTLIQGSQSLFGLKTELRFGRLNVTTIFSQQKGQSQNIQVKNGAQTNEFQIQCDEYEVNKHYFLSQYFADNYDNALRNLPVIQSQINITRIEVWVTNRNSTTSNTRNIVAFQDMGEPNPYASGVLVGTGGNLPDSAANNLYMFLRGVGLQNIRDITKVSTSSGLLPFAGPPANFSSPTDYEKLADARLLQSNEYTLNSQLGYISLNRGLNADEILAVAFEYTVGNQIHRVGELTTQGVQPPQALLVKLLKSRNVNTTIPIWDLMMKNVYNIGAYQLSRQDFKLDILYYDDNTGSWVNYIPVGKDEVN